MYILGLDVGIAITGWAVIDKISANNLKAVDYGAVKTLSKEVMANRLDSVYKEVRGVIQKYKPQEAAIESIFYFKNQKTIIPVSQARGVLILACIHEGIFPIDYTPLEVKTAITGYGRAEKSQVQRMVKAIFKLKEIPKPDDVADAIAIAFCHASIGKTLI